MADNAEEPIVAEGLAVSETVPLVFVTSAAIERTVKENCKNLLRLLHNLHISFEEIDCAEDSREFEEASTASGSKNLPQVFLGGKYVGNYVDFAEWAEDGIVLDQLRELGYVHGA